MLVKLEDILTRIGKRITYFREQKSLKQTELADLLDKDRQVVQRLETGRVNPAIKTLHEVASALKIEITDLLSNRKLGNDVGML